MQVYDLPEDESNAVWSTRRTAAAGNACTTAKQGRI